MRVRRQSTRPPIRCRGTRAPRPACPPSGPQTSAAQLARASCPASTSGGSSLVGMLELGQEVLGPAPGPRIHELRGRGIGVFRRERAGQPVVEQIRDRQDRGCGVDQLRGRLAGGVELIEGVEGKELDAGDRIDLVGRHPLEDRVHDAVGAHVAVVIGVLDQASRARQSARSRSPRYRRRGCPRGCLRRAPDCGASRATGAGCPTAASRSAVPARSGSDGFRECPKGPRADGRQWRGRSQHRDRMLESEQTLIPAFPRGPDAGVSGLETVSGAGGTADGARRERGARPGGKAYAVAAACHASSRRKPCISHSGTFAARRPRPRIGSQLSGVARPGVWTAPGNRFGGRRHGGAVSFGKQNNRGRGPVRRPAPECRPVGTACTENVRPFSFRESCGTLEPGCNSRPNADSII